MKFILLLAIGVAYFVGCARAQSSNETNETEPQPFITCPPEPTCPPIQECTCPPVTECPTMESTRTRGRTRTDGPGTRTNRTDTRRTRTGPGRRTGRTNRTRTDGGRTGPGGRTRNTNRTRTDTGRTRTGPGGRTGRTNRTRTDTGKTRTGPGGRTGRTNRTRTDTGRTRTGPGGRTGRTNRTRTDTGRTRTSPGRTGRTNRTRTGTGRTRPKPLDCTPRLPPGCEDFVTTTGPVIFTTGITESPSTSSPPAGTTTSSPPPPLPDTTPPPPPSNITACSSLVTDVSGQREIPVIALQFYVSQNPYMFAREAADFAEVVTLLASESAGVDKVSAVVLGISTQENGLLSVIVAVSYNVTTTKKASFQSSSGIMEVIYEHLDQLGEYYQVTDMRAVRMVAQSYSPGPSDSTKSGATKTPLSASAVATIIVSMLALTGILGTFVILVVKLSSGLTQRSNEKQPLLKDRVRSLSTVIWRKKNNAIIF